MSRAVDIFFVYGIFLVEIPHLCGFSILYNRRILTVTYNRKPKTENGVRAG